MRADRTMMRELATHTRLNPQGRVQRLLSFNQRIQREPQAVQELTEWNMQLDQQLMEIPGRIFDQEKIIFGRQTFVMAGEGAEWTREVRNKPMLQSVSLTEWVVIVPNRNVRDSQVSFFIQTIIQYKYVSS